MKGKAGNQLPEQGVYLKYAGLEFSQWNFAKRSYICRDAFKGEGRVRQSTRQDKTRESNTRGQNAAEDRM